MIYTYQDTELKTEQKRGKEKKTLFQSRTVINGGR
jgi:hypothetical protein